MGSQAIHLHKALLPIGDRPVLSRILDHFPASMPVVVAVGHLAFQMRNYFKLAHPERKVAFMDIPNYNQKGSGPGASLLYCRPEIRGPFYLITVDTLFFDPLPPLNRNWLGTAPIENPARFCTVAIDAASKILSIADKQPNTKNRLAWIGFAGIYDADIFWKSLMADATLINGERQLSNGFQGLIPAGLFSERLNWLDTGSPESYATTRKYFEKDASDFTKESEQTYLVGNRVIKWFQNREVTSQRVDRAKDLEPHVPPVHSCIDQFFAYEKVPGTTLYYNLERLNSKQLFTWLQKEFWGSKFSPQMNRSEFELASIRFYRDKTFERLQKGLEKTDIQDAGRIVNGVQIPSIKDLLLQIDWDKLAANGLPSRFHGDLQFDNIIFTNDPKSPFLLIDWRQDFGGLPYGDRYYDLAKLNGGLSLNYAEIKDGRPLELDIYENGQKIRLADMTNQRLSKLKHEFDLFCAKAGYNLKRIELITALVYLNMSPLHAAPFSNFLIYYGQFKLAQTLMQKPKFGSKS